VLPELGQFFFDVILLESVFLENFNEKGYMNEKSTSHKQITIYFYPSVDLNKIGKPFDIISFKSGLFQMPL
jgi:hypothetical protein